MPQSSLVPTRPRPRSRAAAARYFPGPGAVPSPPALLDPPRGDPDRPADGRARRHHRERRPPAHPARAWASPRVRSRGSSTPTSSPSAGSSSSAPGPVTCSAAGGSSWSASPSSRSARSSAAWPSAGGRSWPPGRSKGMGAALAAPCALSLLTTAFPEGPQRVRAIGLYTTVSAAGGATGLVAGWAAHAAGLVALGHVRQRAHRAGRLAHRSGRAWSRRSASTATST